MNKDEKKKLMNDLIDVYEKISNLFIDVTPSMFEKHIKSINESDLILARQKILKGKVVALIDLVHGDRTNLSKDNSPFKANAAEIKGVLIK